MAKQSRDAVGARKLTALAYRGYFKGEEILESAQAGINVLVPKPSIQDFQRAVGTIREGRAPHDHLFLHSLGRFQPVSAQRLSSPISGPSHLTLD